MRIAIKFAYDGKEFEGYARQPNLKTVEEDLIKSLIKHEIILDAKKSLFRSASRTDKNVSALGNVVAFNTNVSEKKIMKKLSDDFSSIIVYGIKKVDPDFYPRYAKMRVYSYYLPIFDLDIDKIISASASFTGKHNFSNFAKLEPSKNPIRTIDNIIFSFHNNFLIIDFYAQTFLWHQIRRIINALIKVGDGKIEETQIIDALEKPDKKVDFGLASAEPLILMDIIYNFDFRYTKKQLIKLKNLERLLSRRNNRSVDEVC